MWDGRIFTWRHPKIEEIDAEGNVLNSIRVPPDVHGYGFAALPDNRFAVIYNRPDEIYILDADGQLVTTVSMRDGQDEGLQSTDGVVVGNDLIMSHDGRGRVLRIDLETFEVTTLRDLSVANIRPGAIDSDNEIFYTGAGSAIWRFQSEGEIERVSLIAQHNITAIEIVDDFAFVPVNFGGAILAVDLRTGRSKVLADGLNYPKDLLLLDD